VNLRGMHDASSAGMSWEQRLREMVLAGGALAVTACGGATAAQADAAASNPSNRSDDMSAGQPTPVGTTPTTAPSTSPIGPSGCCNANPDPCCPMAYCAGGVGPDAAVYIRCEQGYTACEAINDENLYDPDRSVCTAPDGSVQPLDAGSVDGGPDDAAPADAGPSDAEPDQGNPVISFCCNANPDPCCPIAYCGGGVGPDAAVYITCERNRAQCESTNREYLYQPDGSLACTPTSATGH
jgi:hypothetical protein